MAALVAGDRDAFTVLVLRHQARAWAVAARFAGQPAAAQDLVQEAFLRVLEAAPRYRPQGRFSSWLLRILVNEALRRPWRWRTVPLREDDHPAGGDPSHALDQAARGRALQDAMARLPAPLRMALTLRYVEELPAAEIGAAMGRSPKAVERLLARGRERLRRSLAGRPTGGLRGGPAR
ncbi:MAG: sigma-70 family RNA polymerase sigma factor [Deltaproteobacteria bacterium]|nr:sigma-70 family RNA polymerase sigma factor [Deltaproteobacteria bacterium]